MNTVQVFSYKGNDVHFGASKSDILINATEMARCFGKLPKDFLKTAPTKAFMGALQARYSLKNNEIIRTSNQNTWMHRTLALKFAAWLNPDFELWVYETIERLITGEFKTIKNINDHRSLIEAEVVELENKLRATVPEFSELEKKRTMLRQLSYQLGQALRPNRQLKMSFV